MSYNTSMPIAECLIDPRLQPPGRHSLSHISDLRVPIKKKKKLPPIKLARLPEGEHYVYDGHHTLAAFEAEGRKEVPVTIEEAATFDEIRLLAATANIKHLALKRTDADKDWAVRTVFEIHPEYSSPRVAKETGTSPTFVEEIRKSIPKAASVKERVGIDNKKRKAKQKREKKKDADAPQLSHDGKYDHLLRAITRLTRDLTDAINEEGGENLLTYLTYFKLIDYPPSVIKDGEQMPNPPRFKGWPGFRRVVKMAALPGRKRTEQQVRAEFARKDDTDE